MHSSRLSGSRSCASLPTQSTAMWSDATGTVSSSGDPAVGRPAAVHGDGARASNVRGSASELGDVAGRADPPASPILRDVHEAHPSRCVSRAGLYSPECAVRRSCMTQLGELCLSGIGRPAAPRAVPAAACLSCIGSERPPLSTGDPLHRPLAAYSVIAEVQEGVRDVTM